MAHPRCEDCVYHCPDSGMNWPLCLVDPDPRDLGPQRGAGAMCSRGVEERDPNWVHVKKPLGRWVTRRVGPPCESTMTVSDWVSIDENGDKS